MSRLRGLSCLAVAASMLLGVSRAEATVILDCEFANIGFFEFESPHGYRLAVVFWPGDQPPTKLDRIGRKENVAARYWLGDGFSFAVMSDKDNPDLESAAKAVFSYYGGALGMK